MLPNCLEVLSVENKNIIKQKAGNDSNSRISKIIPLSESGIPINPPISNDGLNIESSFRQVEIRLVLKIPSQSR